MEQWMSPAAASLVTAAVGYLVHRRKASGRVDVTEAKETWDAQERYIRKLLRRIRDLEILDLERRLENHSWRNQVTRLHFALAGNVPDDLQQEIREMGEAHITELKEALEAKRSAPLNGNGGK